MKDTINYVILPNPLPDAEGNITYQVRQQPAKPEIIHQIIFSKFLRHPI